MKVAVIVYHKNINSLYKKEWIEKSYKSILEQSFSEFSIYELNYGKDDFKLFREYPSNHEYHYYRIEMKNHAEAMNFLFDECLKDGCDVVFNTNLDDISHTDRFKKQLPYIKSGYDIVSSNFTYINDNDEETLKMTFDGMNIVKELNSGNNIICHPSVCYSSKFLKNNRYITSEIPKEDLELWKRTCVNYKFYICKEYLLKYRIHSNQITKNHEKKKIKKEIGLLVIATNKYVDFLNPLIKSADENFLLGHNVTYFIFSNKPITIESKNKIVTFDVKHKAWPWMTLGRYKIFSEHEKFLNDMDFLYYCDVDMIFASRVGDEILSDRVATQHPGYYMTRGTPETDPKSTAFISDDEDLQYFAGGFNGGTSTEYLKMSRILSENIEVDSKNGITAIWHDESHINRYFVDNPPTKILTPSYCYSIKSLGDKASKFKKKIIALEKDSSLIEEKSTKTEVEKPKLDFEPQKLQYYSQQNVYVPPKIDRCHCGEPKDKVKFNYCQRCKRLY